jgi:hypothetical protein
MHYARQYEIRRRREMGLPPITSGELTDDLNDGQAAYVPVVRVAAQLGAVQTLNGVISFFNLPVTNRGNGLARTQVTALFEQCQTEILFIEQFNIFQGSPVGAEVISDQIKFLSEATDGLAMVIIGMDLENESLRANGRSQEIVGQFLDRLSLEKISHPNLDTRGGYDEFLNLLCTWEDRLPLLNKEPGDLTKHTEMIAEVTDRAKTARTAFLIRTSAKMAILDGSEKIGLSHLKSVALNVKKAEPDIPVPTGINFTRDKPRKALAIK